MRQSGGTAYALETTNSGRREVSAVREPGGSAFSTTVELAARISGGRRASLLLPDAERRTLRLAAAQGIPGRVAARVRVRLGEPVAGVVAQTRRPLIVNDHDVIPTHRSRGYQTGAFISVPVPLDDDGCGVLNVADPLRSEG